MRTRMCMCLHVFKYIGCYILKEIHIFSSVPDSDWKLLVFIPYNSVRIADTKLRNVSRISCQIQILYIVIRLSYCKPKKDLCKYKIHVYMLNFKS